MKKMLVLVAFVGMVGCSSAPKFSKTGDVSYDSFPENCEFNIYTTAPKKDFDELGVINLVGNWNGQLPSTIEEVREQVSKPVCENGGNGVLLWESNGFGYYLRTTVIKVK